MVLQLAETPACLPEQHEKKLVRFLTCGSVDDGKSTLIGRLLYDTDGLPDDQIRAVRTQPGADRADRADRDDASTLDFSALLDGLEAEREQGITIDVAYRFFTTDTCRFIVADTPGHEQYTRNMATGASTADAAIILIDARKGVLTQTRRHTYIAHLFRIRHVIVAVNKMDLVGYSQARYLDIAAQYAALTEQLGFDSAVAIPVSAINGDNIGIRSSRMSWHDGPTILEKLESLNIADVRRQLPLRLPVQWVNRPDADFRGYSGSIVSGTVRPGDRIVVAESGRCAQVQAIVTADGPRAEAEAGDAVTLTLDDEIDISRGDVVASASDRPTLSSQFAAHLLWMQDEHMQPGRSYLLKIGSRLLPASVTRLSHKLEMDTLAHRPGRSLALNEIGKCNIRTSQPVSFDAHADIRRTGAFILIDRYTNQTAGAGMILHGLDRAQNLARHAMDTDKTARSALKGHKPCVLWFTGLSGAGKSTIANLVERSLAEQGVHTMSLDGDNVRHGLCRDLGFTDADRVENIRRISEVVRLFVDSGLVVVCSFISPFRAERRMVREVLAEDAFFEIFVDTSLDVCVQRDPKGLYEKARLGKIRNFTGFDSPYEPPRTPDIHIRTSQHSAEDAAARICAILREKGLAGATGTTS